MIGDLLFAPALRDADLELERKVILEEISMVDDTPDDIIFDVHNRVLWGDHAHGFAILGTRETVPSISAARVRALHAEAYQPQRIVVAASGNVPHDVLVEALTRTGWADRAHGKTAVPVVSPVVARPVTQQHVKRKDIAQTHVVLGGVGIAHSDPRRYAFAVVDMILGGGMSSRLFQRVREELGLAYAVHTFSSSYADTGSHGIYVASAPDTAQRALDAAREVLSTLLAEGLSDSQLAAAKQQLRGQLVLSMEGVSSRMYRAASTALYNEPYRSITDIMGLVDAVTRTDVQHVAEQFFDPSTFSLVSVGPKAVH